MPVIIALVIQLSIIFAVIYGYVCNIVSIFTSFDLMTTGEAIVRIGGIIVPLVGAIAGYF